MFTNPLPIRLPPGVSHTSSLASNKGRWFETNLIRWVENEMRPVLGWEKFVTSPAVTMPIRCIHSWADNSGEVFTAILCADKAYIVGTDGVLKDISPTPALVTDASLATTGGYGDATYGTQAYGVPRVETIKAKPLGTTYTMNNWGEDLVFCTSVDGRLLRWKPSTPDDPAEAVPNAPIGIRTFAITQERHLIVFHIGGDYRSWGWCDQEDLENWDFTDPLSTAGRYEIEPSAPIVAAAVSRAGVVIFCSTGVYLARYVGLPYIYSNGVKIADNAVPITAQAVNTISDNVMWWAEDGFWTFDGANVSPVPCPIYDWMTETIDLVTARERVVSVSIGTSPELWWFFPETGGTENSRYMIYDFFRKWWAMGKLNRTAGHSAAFTVYPFMSDGYNLYRHEKGNFYADYVDLPFATSGVLNISSGGKSMMIKQAITDIDTTNPGAVVYDFATNLYKRYIEEASRVKRGLVARPDGYLDIRITGRDHSFTIRSAYNGAGLWSMGEMIVDVAPRGSR